MVMTARPGWKAFLKRDKERSLRDRGNSEQVEEWDRQGMQEDSRRDACEEAEKMGQKKKEDGGTARS